MDALFRKVSRLLSHVIGHAFPGRDGHMYWMRHTSEEQDLIRAIRRGFKDAVEPNLDAYATTLSRIKALCPLLNRELQLSKRRGHGSEIRACVQAFRDIERDNPDELLSDEDLEALETIGLP